MKFKICLLFFFVSFFTKGQEVEYDTIYPLYFQFDESKLDSVNKNELFDKLQKIKRMNDSLKAIFYAKNIELRSDSLIELYNLLSKETSNTYNAYYLMAGPAYADITTLNNSLASKGLPTLNNVHINYAYLISFCFKRKIFVHDFYIGLFHGKKAKKDELEISYSNANLVNYLFGVSILNTKRFDLFPFVGLDLQSSDITFSNSSFDNIPSNISSFDTLAGIALQKKRGTRLMFTKWETVFNYGAEFDVHLKYSKRRRGIILGIRAGKTIPVISSGWKYEKTKFTELPDVNLRAYYINFVLKFYWRKRGHDTYDINNTFAQ